ncbi:MAG: hypothetical protein AB9922_12195 [Bacteroidales bacterium]
MKKFIFTFGIISIIIIYLELKENTFEKAMNFYNEGNLTSAIIELDNIKPGDVKYDEAQILIEKLKKKVKSDIETLRVERKQIENEKRQKDSLRNIANSISEIKTTITMIDNFHIDHYDSSLTGIAYIIKTFKDYESIVNDTKKSEIDSIKRLALIAEKKITSKRVKNWPILRENFAKYLAKELWVHDMYVLTLNTKHTTIEFISIEYALNKNIKKTHDDLYDIFLKLRFKKVIYKTSKYDEDYKYYTLDTKNDSEFEFS